MSGELVIVLAILTIPLIPTFWAILDIPRRRFSSTRTKIIWFAAVSTFPFIGAMFYIIFGRRRTEPLVDIQLEKEA
ncbi:MAG: PLDc_N domain-containing protein [Syntrophobacteraceae bacterium]|nr:PLDc_N domain-containing protein [Syntrophobacteraceae bacterium]